MEEEMTNPNPGPEKKAAGRGIRIALFLSLALNLLVVGMVGGAIWDNRGKIGPRADLGPAMDAGMVPFGQALDRAQRREFGRELANRNRELDQNRGRVREQIEALTSAISAVPFDAEALRSAFTDAQQMLNDRQRIGAEVLIDRIAAMSDEERATFVERLKKSLRGMRPPGSRR